MKLSIYRISLCDLENRLNGLKQKYPWVDWSLVTLEIIGRDYLQINYNQNTYNPNGQTVDLGDYAVYFPEEK